MMMVLFNRFIPGIRSVISFFTGLSEIEFKKTLILSTVSAILWNIILLGLGYIFARNLNKIDYILSTYSAVVLSIVVILIVLAILKYILNKKKGKK